MCFHIHCSKCTFSQRSFNVILQKAGLCAWFVTSQHFFRWILGFKFLRMVCTLKQETSCVQQLHLWNDGGLAVVAVSLQTCVRKTSENVCVCRNTCVDRFFNNSAWLFRLSYISNIYGLIKKQILVFQQNLFASKTFICITLFLGRITLKIRYEFIPAET